MSVSEEERRQKRLAKYKRYRDKHPEKRKAYQQGLREKFPEKAQGWARKSRRKNWAVILLANARGSSKTRGVPPPTIDVAWILSQPLVCPYTGLCLVPPSENENFSPVMPSLDRIDNTKGYDPDNVCLTSWFWNRLRNTMPLEEALTVLNQVAANITERDCG